VRVRVQAMRALGRMAAGEAVADKAATTALEKGLLDTDKKVREAAAESLTAGVPSVKTNLPKLQSLLKNPQPEVRAQAAKAVARLGDKGKPAVPDLLDAARSDNRELRKSGFVALNAVGASAQDMLPVLRAGLKDEDVETRRASLVAAGKAKGEAKDLVPVIVETLSDPDVRNAALDALHNIGPDAREGARVVANLLTADPASREKTLTTLEAMKLNGTSLQFALPKLIAVFEDEKQERILNKTAEVLASVGKPVLQDMCLLLRNQKPQLRAGAAMTLGAMGPTGAAASANLQVAIQVETDAAVKEKELAALRRVNSAPPSKP
jgi:HEAT repeat protein